MKVSIFLFFLIFSSVSLKGQEFEIPPTDQAFYEILEWKGVGALVLSRDPQLNQRQIKISLIASESKTTFQQVMNPMDENVYYLAEDGGKYAYFLEDVEIKNGKVFLHQLSVAGGIKTQNVVFAAPLKKIGSMQVDDMKLLDIITTEKALIWLFTYEDKTAKKLMTIAVCMTHNNFNTYAAIVSENVLGSSKIEDQISWYVAGENGENIVFAARLHSGKDAGWKIKELSPKGIILNEQVIQNQNLKFSSHNRVGFGRRGSSLIKRVEPTENGTLIVYNNTYYVGGIELDGTTGKFVTYKWENKSWVVVAKSDVKGFNAKKELQVGFMQLKEGLGWFVKTSEAQGHFHSFTDGKAIVSSAINQTTSNPSKLLTEAYTGLFYAVLSSKNIVFDPKQLPGKKALKFEYVSK